MSPEELTSKEILDAFKIFSKLKKKHGVKGGGILFRFGNTRLSGSSVKRIHFHIVEPNKNTPTPLWLGSKIQKKNKPTNNNNTK